MDGTDFPIYEPAPFNPMWYSHKFKGPGVRYEVAVCIMTGHIVWVNGPFPCGDWPDLRIARNALVYALGPNELLMADGGYNDGGIFMQTPTGLNDDHSKAMAGARARHETVNRRFKQFGVLNQRYRHKLEYHGIIFNAIANITQLMLENGMPLFGVHYIDP